MAARNAADSTSIGVRCTRNGFSVPAAIDTTLARFVVQWCSKNLHVGPISVAILVGLDVSTGLRLDDLGLGEGLGVDADEEAAGGALFALFRCPLPVDGVCSEHHLSFTP